MLHLLVSSIRCFWHAVLVVAILAICLVGLSTQVNAETEEEMKTLELFYQDKDLVVTPSREPRPVSQVAENVTIVTAREIQALNAHTLADALHFLPGIEVNVKGGPASADSVRIQGSPIEHVLVLIDGVAQNFISSNVSDLGAIPVQMIERIEIVKGPASSAWGSSLGGVINVITKPPNDARAFGGTLSASFGEKTTGDFRADTSGTVGDLGYYLYAGGLTTDGLQPGMPVDRGDMYVKLKWEPSDETRLLFTLGYDRGFRGQGIVPQLDLSVGDKAYNLYYTLALNHALTSKADLDLSFRRSERKANLWLKSLSTGEQLTSFSDDESNTGASVKIVLRQGAHQVVLGGDYDNCRLTTDSVVNGRQRLEKWAIFANDTMVFGPLSVSPGLRYDWTSTNGDFVSPSLGVAFSVMDNTTLRAYVARGFSIPPIASTFSGGFNTVANPDLKMEKVWSYTAGVESSALRYVWLKAMLFRHDVSDILANVGVTPTTFKTINKGRKRLQGVEIESRTAPLLNFSLLLGYTFVDSRDRDTDEIEVNMQRYTFDFGVDYQYAKSFSGTLRGHYIGWNEESALKDTFTPIVWDLHLSQKVYTRENLSAELFFSVRNLFNGTQTLDSPFPNNSRWVEGGARLAF